MSKKLLKFLAFSCLYAWFGLDGVRGQSTTVAPDCIIPFSLSAVAAPVNAPSGGQYDNRSKQCVSWQISYQAPTGVSAISLALQSASDTAGVPGSFGTFSGTTITGTNPFGNGSLPNSFYSVQGNPAWVRVRLISATGTGTVTGFAYGWKIPPQVYTAGASGGPTSNVNVAQYGGTNTTLGQKAMASSIPVTIASDQTAVGMNLAQVNGHTTQEGGTSGSLAVGGQAAAGSAAAGNPVLIAGQDASSNARVPLIDSTGGAYQFSACGSSAEVTLSGTGYNQIVAATASQVTRVCKIVLLSASGGNPSLNTFSIATGTCGSSPTELVNYPAVTGIAEEYGGALRTGTNQALCISESTANSDKVTVFYAKASF